MKRLGIGCLAAIPAYFAGLFVSMWLIQTFSSNTHDRAVEAGMSGAFFFGPLAAAVAFLLGVVLSGRRVSASARGQE